MSPDPTSKPNVMETPNLACLVVYTKLKIQLWDNDVIIVISRAHFRKMTSLWSKNNRSVVEWIERMILKR